MVEVVLFAVSFCLVVTLVYRWWVESRRHGRRLEDLQLRVHVNGTRGKSTVTRMIAGMLREAGINTVAKTTGSAAVFINSQGEDIPLRRRGAATILEQVNVFKERLEPDCQALVVECMAIRPSIQEASESHLVQSMIGVITNIRQDHQEVMGETLPDIARSLLSTCPQNGILVTSERDPQLLQILKEGAQRRNSRLIIAEPGWVTGADLAQFKRGNFSENIAVGLAIASVLNIPRDTAIKGMAKSAPDPGELTIRNAVVQGKLVTWANLFAVNDRESALILFGMLASYRTPDTTTIVVLNNRLDRELRAMLFADVAAVELKPDRIAALGHYARSVTDRLITDGFPQDRIVDIGTERDLSIDEMLSALLSDIPTPHVLLVGLANLHTPQAALLRDFFDGLPRSETFDSLCLFPDYEPDPLVTEGDQEIPGTGDCQERPLAVPSLLRISNEWERCDLCPVPHQESVGSNPLPAAER